MIVLDRQTGREQCFTVDIGAGDAEPCQADAIALIIST